jgi:hypothetical protein
MSGIIVGCRSFAKPIPLFARERLKDGITRIVNIL